MKRVFETAECEEVFVRNSIFWELRYEKHENQMTIYDYWRSIVVVSAYVGFDQRS